MEIIATNYKNDSVVEVDGKYFVVRIEDGQVKSTLYSDMPADGGTWVAGNSDKGVKYVANPRTRAAAMAALRNLEEVTIAMSNGQTDCTRTTHALDFQRAAKRLWPYARDYSGTCTYRVYDEREDIIEEGKF